MTPTDGYFTSDLISMVLKVRFSSSVMPRNLTVEIFVRIDYRILMFNVFIWLEIIIYEVLLTFRENLLVLSQLPTSTSYLFTVA